MTCAARGPSSGELGRERRRAAMDGSMLVRMRDRLARPGPSESSPRWPRAWRLDVHDVGRRRRHDLGQRRVRGLGRRRVHCRRCGAHGGRRRGRRDPRRERRPVSKRRPRQGLVVRAWSARVRIRHGHAPGCDTVATCAPVDGRFRRVTRHQFRRRAVGMSCVVRDRDPRRTLRAAGAHLRLSHGPVRMHGRHRAHPAGRVRGRPMALPGTGRELPEATASSRLRLHERRGVLRLRLLHRSGGSWRGLRRRPLDDDAVRLRPLKVVRAPSRPAQSVLGAEDPADRLGVLDRGEHRAERVVGPSPPNAPLGASARACGPSSTRNTSWSFFDGASMTYAMCDAVERELLVAAADEDARVGHEVARVAREPPRADERRVGRRPTATARSRSMPSATPPTSAAASPGASACSRSTRASVGTDRSIERTNESASTRAERRRRPRRSVHGDASGAPDQSTRSPGSSRCASGRSPLPSGALGSTPRTIAQRRSGASTSWSVSESVRRSAPGRHGADEDEIADARPRSGSSGRARS